MINSPLAPRVSLALACGLGLASLYLLHRRDLKLRRRSPSGNRRWNPRSLGDDKAPKGGLVQRIIGRVKIFDEGIQGSHPSDPPKVYTDPGQG